jgi:ketosteroid isomerase-like protein
VVVSDAAEIVRRYFAIVADLGSSQDEFEAVLHPDIRVIEHPNAMNAKGAVRDRDHMVEGFLAGKQLLTTQAIDVHELVSDGDRVAVRATWRGTTGDGTELVAHIAGWLTVADGRIREHETFDCYEPFTPRS